MDAENFAEWYRRQGHSVVRTDSSYWFDAGPRVYQAFPFGWLIEPTGDELAALMWKHKILSLRYSTSLQAPIGKVSYHVTLSDPYNLDLLRSQARNAVRRGLANSLIEPVPFERVADEGWRLQQDTLARQGRTASMSQADWVRICHSAIGLEGFEAWAAIVQGEMAASVIICRIEDTFYVPYAFSHSQYLDLYVNNALFYTFSCDLLARAGVKRIFFTVQSLDAPKSVDEFKFRMGLHAQAVRQRVVFHPLLEPFISASTHRIVTGLQKRYPARVALAKLEGMMRFYLEGKLPISQQAWPDCLAASKPGSPAEPSKYSGEKRPGLHDARTKSGAVDGKS